MDVLEHLAELLGRVKARGEAAQERHAQVAFGRGAEQEQVVFDHLAQQLERGDRVLLFLRELQGQGLVRHVVAEQALVVVPREEPRVARQQEVLDVRVRLAHGVGAGRQAAHDAVGVVADETPAQLDPRQVVAVDGDQVRRGA